jgi:hypothetical protein
MMRTSARQVSPSPTPFLLSATRCSVCGAAPITILASGRNDNGAIERFYCDFRCAATEGWPWLDDPWQRNDDLFKIGVGDGEKTE